MLKLYNETNVSDQLLEKNAKTDTGLQKRTGHCIFGQNPKNLAKTDMCRIKKAQLKLWF